MALCAIVLTVEQHGTARWLIEPVQQPQEGRLPRPARTDDRQHLAFLHLHADIAYQNLVHDSAGEIPGFDRYSLSRPVRRAAVRFVENILRIR